MADPHALALGIAVALGVAGAFGLDFLTASRGFLPPGFRQPWRRLLAGLAIAFLMGLGIFAPLAALLTGVAVVPDMSNVKGPDLFRLHLWIVSTLGIWFLLGYAGRPRSVPAAAAAYPVPVQDAPPPPEDGAAGLDPEGMPAEPPPVETPPARVSLGRQFLAQFGLLAPSPGQEVGLGLALGLGIWLAVLMVLIAVAFVLYAVAGEKAIPQQQSAVVPFLAGLPWALRLALSLSAGVVEETFFRGFLQPRIGLVLSTALFALAHLSYGQPFLLVGITLLSLTYGLLVRWRQSVWAAIAAHALFDAIQLLVAVPAALKMIDATGGGKAAFLHGLVW